MSLVPPNLIDFYDDRLEYKSLYQGDIIDSTGIGLKDNKNPKSPDHWIIISKNCDIVLDEQGVIRKSVVGLLPLIKFSIFKDVAIGRIKSSLHHSSIVLLPLITVSAISKWKTVINELVRDRLSKFMFLPPDGKVLKEPVVADFDILRSFDGQTQNNISKLLKSKRLQLRSPFREKLGQRFAQHFSSIGVNDDHIRSKEYQKLLKEYDEKS